MERREEILAATCAVICRDGIDGVRSSAIAAEAGLTVCVDAWESYLEAA